MAGCLHRVPADVVCTMSAAGPSVVLHLLVHCQLPRPQVHRAASPGRQDSVRWFNRAYSSHFCALTGRWPYLCPHHPVWDQQYGLQVLFTLIGSRTSPYCYKVSTTFISLKLYQKVCVDFILYDGVQMDIINSFIVCSLHYNNYRPKSY